MKRTLIFMLCAALTPPAMARADDFTLGAFWDRQTRNRSLLERNGPAPRGLSLTSLNLERFYAGSLLQVRTRGHLNHNPGAVALWQRPDAWKLALSHREFERHQFLAGGGAMGRRGHQLSRVDLLVNQLGLSLSLQRRDVNDPSGRFEHYRSERWSARLDGALGRRARGAMAASGQDFKPDGKGRLLTAKTAQEWRGELQGALGKAWRWSLHLRRKDLSLKGQPRDSEMCSFLAVFSGAPAQTLAVQARFSSLSLDAPATQNLRTRKLTGSRIEALWTPRRGVWLRAAADSEEHRLDRLTRAAFLAGSGALTREDHRNRKLSLHMGHRLGAKLKLEGQAADVRRSGLPLTRLAAVTAADVSHLIFDEESTLGLTLKLQAGGGSSASLQLHQNRKGNQDRGIGRKESGWTLQSQGQLTPNWMLEGGVQQLHLKTEQRQGAKAPLTPADITDNQSWLWLGRQRRTGLLITATRPVTDNTSLSLGADAAMNQDGPRRDSAWLTVNHQLKETAILRVTITGERLRGAAQGGYHHAGAEAGLTVSF